MKRLLGWIALGVAAIMASAQWSNPADDVPAYNAGQPTHALPPLLGGNQLTGPYFQHGYQAIVYKMAVSVSGVLYQQPCYCRCDLGMGHSSLRSCFETTHGAACSTCMREAVYSYQQTKQGKTPEQVRAGIERGEWQNIDLTAAAL